MRKNRLNAYVLAFIGVMAAIIYVVTMFRFPLLGSKVHFANAFYRHDIGARAMRARTED